MSKARLIITAITIQGLTQAEAARTYGVSPGWVSKLMARWRIEGDAALEPRSRRPRTTPNAIPPTTVELIVQLREQLTRKGLDAGAHTIAWHLHHHHDTVVSPATIWRTLKRARPHQPGAEEAPEIVLRPLRSRAAQRMLAVRRHPLPPHRRHDQRDPDLAG